MNPFIEKLPSDQFLGVLLKIVSIPILWGIIQLIFVLLYDINTYFSDSLIISSAIGFIIIGLVLRYVVKILFNRYYSLKDK